MNQLILWTLLLLLSSAALGQDCPLGCVCNQPQTIFCTSRKGDTIPAVLSTDTTNLYVFNNNITLLREDTFKSLPELQLLDLSQNKISSIPKNVFQPLTNLINLDLSSNQLQEITNETFHGLRLLERLYLDKNQIQHIHPAAFDTLEKLLELKLQNNQLQSVPPLNLPNLLLLDISHNKMATIESGTFHTVNIESLKIAGLGLTHLDEELLENLNNLHQLDISDNLLDRVPKVLQGLRGLTKLNLAGNAQISQLQAEDFHDLQNLLELDISNLNLNTIPRDFSTFFPRLKAITAAENPFNCICQMSWFVHWVHTSKVALKRPEETRCHFPPKNAGKLLQKLEYVDFGCPTTTTTTTTTTTLKTTTLKPAMLLTTNKHFPLDPSTTAPTPEPVLRQDSSTAIPFTVLDGQTSAEVQICPPRTCLNGGTCQLNDHNHLECVCPAGFSGLYCESEFRRTTISTITQTATQTKKINIKQVGSSSLKVDLQNYIQSKAQLKGIRLTYRNLSGPDKRPVTLSLPASLSEYTVRALKPNSTYHICIGPLGEKISEEEFCIDAQTLHVTHQQHSPVTQSKDSNLTLMIVPALAAGLLLVVAVAIIMYYRRHRPAKTHSNTDVDSSPLELEGVKTCLENGDLSNQNQKLPENTTLPNSLECEVPLMQPHYPSNNNTTTALKPSYF
ncbi:PREDICTED: vasorin [Gavialis gangeticus]|uniref:vasorin n=1 Tax=Gavialis gangeticus TaxID=94835 RepID=UPI00092ED873|nr:PREDICTED: vasorin [Gavialis gangeticus]